MDANYFITGCASGIARQLTKMLLKRGARVFAADIDLAGLEAAAHEEGWPAERVRLARLDVTDAAAWAEVFAAAVHEFGHIDGCLNIAGVLGTDWVHEEAASLVHRQIDVNVKGVIFGTMTAARHMIPRRAGRIVNMGSIAGSMPVPGMATYAASKYAVRGYSLSAMMELRRHGVFVTAVILSPVSTPMLTAQLDSASAGLLFSHRKDMTTEEAGRILLRRVLLKRRPPYEIFVPRLRTGFGRIVDLWPALGAIHLPVSQRLGQRRMRLRRAAGKHQD
jgi:3-oxoacyl-[acyl-carrier protein] reductase